MITLQNKTTHEIKKTTDPGRALITGAWKDIGKFKGPVLRGLASRPPYFQNGLAATLGNVLDFYDKRLHIGFTSQERRPRSIWDIETSETAEYGPFRT